MNAIPLNRKRTLLPQFITTCVQKLSMYCVEPRRALADFSNDDGSRHAFRFGWFPALATLRYQSPQERALNAVHRRIVGLNVAKTWGKRVLTADAKRDVIAYFSNFGTPYNRLPAFIPLSRVSSIDAGTTPGAFDRPIASALLRSAHPLLLTTRRTIN
jgi:hypothetical protein